MATAFDPRLRESLELLHDPALADPARVPWFAIALAAAVVALAVAVLLWLRRKPVVRALTPLITVPEPQEDTLAALAGVWAAASPERLIETLEALSTILRRYLGRQVHADLTTQTTTQLTQFCAVLRGFATLHEQFYLLADLIRFAGLAATLTDIEPLYEAACAYVRANESRQAVPFPSSSASPETRAVRVAA
jgi:hypothetical protein